MDKPNPSPTGEILEAGDTLAAAARNAVAQIEYLHGLFGATGSGNGVIANLNYAVHRWEKINGR